MFLEGFPWDIVQRERQGVENTYFCVWETFMIKLYVAEGVAVCREQSLLGTCTAAWGGGRQRAALPRRGGPGPVGSACLSAAHSFSLCTWGLGYSSFRKKEREGGGKATSEEHVHIAVACAPSAPSAPHPSPGGGVSGPKGAGRNAETLLACATQYGDLAKCRFTVTL